MSENTVIRDNNGVPIGVAPVGIEDVLQDTPIPHKAIRSMDTFGFYFNGDTETTFTWPAGESLAINKNMRLSTTVQCLVY